MRLFLFIGVLAASAAGYLIVSDHYRLSNRIAEIERRPVVAAPAEAAPRQIFVPVETGASAANLVAAAVAAAPSAPPSPSDPAAPEIPIPDPEEAERFKTQVRGELDDFFARLPPNASATRAVRSDLQEAFGKLQLPDAAAPVLDCRGAVCRADFLKVEPTRARELLMSMTTIGWTGPMTAYIVHDDRGGQSVRVFAAAPGAEMPTPHG